MVPHPNLQFDYELRGLIVVWGEFWTVFGSREGRKEPGEAIRGMMIAKNWGLHT